MRHSLRPDFCFPINTLTRRIPETHMMLTMDVAPGERTFNPSQYSDTRFISPTTCMRGSHVFFPNQRTHFCRWTSGRIGTAISARAKNDQIAARRSALECSIGMPTPFYCMSSYRHCDPSHHHIEKGQGKCANCRSHYHQTETGYSVCQSMGTRTGWRQPQKRNAILNVSLRVENEYRRSSGHTFH